MKTNFKITNLNCEACVKLSNMALKKISGVQKIEIDLASGNVELESDRELNWEEIKNNLAEVDKIAEK